MILSGYISRVINDDNSVGCFNMDNNIDFIESCKYIDELRSAGLTWDEVTIECNKKYGVEYSESKWRKPYDSWRKTIDDVLNDDDNELFEREYKKLVKAQTRLEIERQKINAKKAVLRHTVKQNATYELFNEEVSKSIEELSPNLSKVDVKVEDDVLEIRNFVFGRSDGHYDGNQDLGIEFREIIDLIAKYKKIYKFKEIIFIEGGDAIDGATLRPSQLLAIREGIVEQAGTLGRYYVEFLNTLTRELKINVKFCIVESSNHTQLRTFGSGRSELPMEDMMKVVADYVKLGTSNNKRVEVISAPRIIVTINGLNYLIEHGHDIKNKNKHIQEIETYYGITIHYAYFGHWHSYKSEKIVWMEKEGFDKHATFFPHSDVNQDDYAEGMLLKLCPSIYFGIDSNEGKLMESTLPLKKSWEKAKEQDRSKQIIKI